MDQRSIFLIGFYYALLTSYLGHSTPPIARISPSSPLLSYSTGNYFDLTNESEISPSKGLNDDIILVSSSGVPKQDHTVRKSKSLQTIQQKVLKKAKISTLSSRATSIEAIDVDHIFQDIQGQEPESDLAKGKETRPLGNLLSSFQDLCEPEIEKLRAYIVKEALQRAKKDLS